MNERTLSAPEKLTAEHDLSDLDSGVVADVCRSVGGRKSAVITALPLVRLRFAPRAGGKNLRSGRGAGARDGGLIADGRDSALEGPQHARRREMACRFIAVIGNNPFRRTTAPHPP